MYNKIFQDAWLTHTHTASVFHELNDMTELS